MRHHTVFISLLVVVAAFGAVSAIAETGSKNTESTDQERTYPDYSGMLRFLTEEEFDSLREDLRVPTREEVEELGPLWPDVPPEQNAALFYAEAGRMLHWTDEPPGSLSGTKPYAGDRAAFERWIGSNHAALDMLRRAQQLEFCQIPVLIDQKSGMPKISSSLTAHLSQLSRTCLDGGFLAEVQENADGAASWYLACLRLGSDTRRNCTLNQSQWGLGFCSRAARTLDALIANFNLSAKALEKIIAGCANAEANRGHVLDTLRREATYQDAVLAHTSDGESWKSFLNRSTRPYGADDPAPPKDFAECRRMMRRLNEVLLQLYDRPIPEILREKEQLWGTVLDDIMGYQALANHIENYRNWPTWLGRLNLSLRVTQIRAAIALFQKTHDGEPPETLEELCPDILPEVPMDPFSGKPMRYVREGTGWKCWSVGFDLKDDGGIGVSRTYLGMPVSGDWVGMDCVYYSIAPSNVEVRSNR